MRRKALYMSLLLILLCPIWGLADDDIGPYPENYKEIVTAYYNQTLFDPYSAVIKFTREPVECFMEKGLLEIGFISGWVVCGTINAKNRFGGYVGTELFSALIRNGKVVKAYTGMIAEETCWLHCK
jgi:hypothetical protein